MSDTDKEFDLLGFVQGRSRAKDSITLYMDEDAANEASKHLKLDSKGKPIAVIKDHEDEYKAAKERLDASGVTIHLEGASEGRVQELRDEFGIKGDGNDDKDNYESWVVAVLIEQYKKTVSANGQETEKALTSEQWFEFKKAAPRTQWRNLLEKVVELVYVSAMIDENTDAGFLVDS